MTSAMKLWRGLLHREQWNIGVVRRPIHEFLQPNVGVSDAVWAPTRGRNKFLADCFRKNSGARGVDILCEDFDWRSCKGVISRVTFTDEEGFSNPTPITDESFHMSYPCPVEYNGETYYTPETSEAEEVGLYGIDEYTGELRKVTTLIPNVAAVDPTAFQHGRLWWLLFKERSSLADLFAWYAPDLFGPWKPHQRNPVKSDIRSSRPAGTPFIHEGQLYRPAQDYSIVSQGRVALNRVTQLTPEEFSEEVVRYIGPDKSGPYPDGLHTISSAGEYTLIDSKRYMLTPANAIRLLTRRALP